MLGTADEIRRDDGDIDPRRLGLVLMAAVLMAIGIGAGVWLTASGERPIADTSIVNVPRLRHDPIAPARLPGVGGPTVAPAAEVPAPPAVVPAGPPPAPVAPHAVDVPVVIDPNYTGPVDAPVPVDLPAPPEDSAPVAD
ncbi:hypothetical protein [Nocardia heshunensis]